MKSNNNPILITISGRCKMPLQEVSSKQLQLQHLMAEQLIDNQNDKSHISAYRLEALKTLPDTSVDLNFATPRQP
jgi:hypothetical protein